MPDGNNPEQDPQGEGARGTEPISEDDWNILERPSHLDPTVTPEEEGRIVEETFTEPMRDPDELPPKYSIVKDLRHWWRTSSKVEKWGVLGGAAALGLTIAGTKMGIIPSGEKKEEKTGETSTSAPANPESGPKIEIQSGLISNERAQEYASGFAKDVNEVIVNTPGSVQKPSGTKDGNLRNEAYFDTTSELGGEDPHYEMYVDAGTDTEDKIDPNKVTSLAVKGEAKYDGGLTKLQGTVIGLEMFQDATGNWTYQVHWYDANGVKYVTNFNNNPTENHDSSEQLSHEPFTPHGAIAENNPLDEKALAQIDRVRQNILDRAKDKTSLGQTDLGMKG